MHKSIVLYITMVLFSGIHIPDFAQTSDSSELILADIFKNGKFRQSQIGTIHWMKDGYATLEPNSEIGGKDIVFYDAKTDSREILVPAKRLILPGKNDPIAISVLTWSDDDQKVLIFTNTRRVFRQNTRGDYWVLDLNSGAITQLGQNFAPSSLMFAKFSPDASRVGYIYKSNIYVENPETGQIIQLTTDGNDVILNGLTDWVYEEEFFIRDGFRWSPDSRTIAYWRFNTEDVGVFTIINNIDSIYPELIKLRYPKAGTANSEVTIGVVSAEGGETRWIEFPGSLSGYYLPRMDFIPNSNEIIVQQLNRLQNNNTVWIADLHSMQLRKILTDSDDAFLDIHDPVLWMDDEKYFTWTSEKDGWRHIYQVSKDGKSEHLITSGAFDVVKICGITEKKEYLYYIASPDNPAERYLYRSRLDGKGKAERVTPENMPGKNSYRISPDARWAIQNYENVTTPNQYYLVSLPDHKTIRVLEDNADAKARIDALTLNPKEFFRIDIGDTELDAWMIKPANFDASKKYPVLLYVYGEPFSTTVQNMWKGGDLWHHYLAQQGYIVMSIDPRGTNAPRGREWRKMVYGKIGILGPGDISAGMREVLKQNPFMDAERVGIWGWSGGGQMTLHCMFRYPEIFKTGIAVAFISDRHLYNTVYEERYLGLLPEKEDDYVENSAISHAGKLEGNLLIIHGTSDDNVHYQGFEMLVNELIKDNKMFQMMSYPMRSHGISERENTRYHLRQVMERFWLEYLPIEPK